MENDHSACQRGQKSGARRNTLHFGSLLRTTILKHSHGFRPKRGCHTALTEIHNTWKGTKWFIEGDIKGCFDNIEHHTLMNILRENIQDNRFLRLIEGALKAGYCEDWTYYPSLSGTPQGGIVSPILSNIYLDRLDRFIQETLIPEYTRGKERSRSLKYHSGRT